MKVYKINNTVLIILMFKVIKGYIDHLIRCMIK